MDWRNHRLRGFELSAAREPVVMDGKALGGSKTSPEGAGAPYPIAAFATVTGLELAQCAVGGKSNLARSAETDRGHGRGRRTAARAAEGRHGWAALRSLAAVEDA